MLPAPCPQKSVELVSAWKTAKKKTEKKAIKSQKVGSDGIKMSTTTSNQSWRSFCEKGSWWHGIWHHGLVRKNACIRPKNYSQKRDKEKNTTTHQVETCHSGISTPWDSRMVNEKGTDNLLSVPTNLGLTGYNEATGLRPRGKMQMLLRRRSTKVSKEFFVANTRI